MVYLAAAGLTVTFYNFVYAFWGKHVANGVLLLFIGSILNTVLGVFLIGTAALFGGDTRLNGNMTHPDNPLLKFFNGSVETLAKIHNLIMADGTSLGMMMVILTGVVIAAYFIVLLLPFAAAAAMFSPAATIAMWIFFPIWFAIMLIALYVWYIWFLRSYVDDKKEIVASRIEGIRSERDTDALIRKINADKDTARRIVAEHMEFVENNSNEDGHWIGEGDCPAVFAKYYRSLKILGLEKVGR